MKRYAHKFGAIFYGLWGALHVLGAAVLLQQSTDGPSTMLTTIGSGTPVAEIPQITDELATAVLAYYAWNLLWIGAFVLVMAIRQNWKNSPMGYWLNLALVSAVDLGLIIFLIAPGYMALSDGLMGVILWIPAVVFSSIGLFANRWGRGFSGKRPYSASLSISELHHLAANSAAALPGKRDTG